MHIKKIKSLSHENLKKNKQKDPNTTEMKFQKAKKAKTNKNPTRRQSQSLFSQPNNELNKEKNNYY